MTFAFPSIKDVVDRRTLASLLIVVRNRIRSSWRTLRAEDFWKALVHFCVCSSSLANNALLCLAYKILPAPHRLLERLVQLGGRAYF